MLLAQLWPGVGNILAERRTGGWGYRPVGSRWQLGLDSESALPVRNGPTQRACTHIQFDPAHVCKQRPSPSE